MRPLRWLRVAWLATILSTPLWTSAQDSGATLTFDPVMVKGPATARVTIIEFSDYQ